jgi:hypothetical protein
MDRKNCKIIPSVDEPADLIELHIHYYGTKVKANFGNNFLFEDFLIEKPHENYLPPSAIYSLDSLLEMVEYFDLKLNCFERRSLYLNY